MASREGVDGKCVYFLQLIFLLASLINSAAAECNVCQENQVACINSTSYYLCYGEGTPNTDHLFHCKAGFDCTNLNVICLQSSNWLKPSCGDTSLCGLCSAHPNYLFACHSRTTFQMCYGAIHPTGQIGYCPNGYVCDASSDAVCVVEAEVNTITCDVVSNDPGTTSTTEIATTTSTTSTTTTTTTTERPTTSPPLTANEVCAQQGKVGLYPPVPNDPYCQSYIYCSYSNGVIRGSVYICPTGTYYIIAENRCTRNKPNSCL